MSGFCSAHQHSEPGCKQCEASDTVAVEQIRSCLEWRDGPLSPERRVQVIAGRGEEFWYALRLLFSARSDEMPGEFMLGFVIDDGEVIRIGADEIPTARPATAEECQLYTLVWQLHADLAWARAHRAICTDTTGR